ncbi:MAG: DUF4416 family protein [Pseudomonadota bacterium]
MSTPQKPKPAKLIVGLFLNDKVIIRKVTESLAAYCGQPDAVSPWLSFHHTDYYAPEMGQPLFRRLFAFADLIEQDTLSDIKLFANKLEQDFMSGGKRLVNIDPGYLLAERFVLATGKNYTHRIYLRDGIYADLTLIYNKGIFHPLDWTYPDYTEGEMFTFLECVRKKYLWQIKGDHSPHRKERKERPEVITDVNNIEIRSTKSETNSNDQNTKS